VNGGAKTAVVTDSTHGLPDEEIRRHDIHVVSLYVSLGGEQQQEAEIADYADFYGRLADSGKSVTTSQPSVGDFVAVYEPLLAAGRDVVSLHLSAGISGTCEAALQARQSLIDEGRGGERIHVYDSRTAAAGLGFSVLAAARAATGGADAAETLERAERARAGLQLWFAVDTLEYLRRGGRIGAASALLGSTLKIKPILTFEEQVEPVERVRTRRRAFERLVEYGRKRHADGGDAWVVQHIRSADAARQLVEQCREIFGRGPLFVTEIGPVLGAHVGPGLLGVGGVPPEVYE
jgi:fatty acid kinase fatty acid binding subunit